MHCATVKKKNRSCPFNQRHGTGIKGSSDKKTHSYLHPVSWVALVPFFRLFLSLNTKAICVFLSSFLRQFLLQLTTSELMWLNLYIQPLYHHPQPSLTDIQMFVSICMCGNPELHRRDVHQWSQLIKVTRKPISTHTYGSLYLIFSVRKRSTW